MNEQSVICPYCEGAAPLVSGLQVYPGRRDLWSKKFYKCTPCDAWVGCHPPANAEGRGGVGDGTVPLGPLANAALRTARQAAHAAFDGIWRSRRMSRRRAYIWLAHKLRMDIADCHIGHFDEAQCAKVVAAVLAFERKELARVTKQEERRRHAD